MQDVINQAIATVRVNGYNVTYNGKPHSATGTATGVGGVNLASDLTLSSTHTNAGTYPDNRPFNAATNSSFNPNYTTQSGTMTDIIKPAPLIVVALNESMNLGATLPALTVNYGKLVNGVLTDGFVNGETAAVFNASGNTAPTATTKATSSSPAGKYAITLAGAVDPNYTITYDNGTLTITKPPVIVG